MVAVKLQEFDVVFLCCCVSLLPVESLTDAIRDGIQDFAYRATGIAQGDVTFETVNPVSRFSGYRPVVVPASDLDRPCVPAETVTNKTTKTIPAS